MQITHLFIFYFIYGFYNDSISSSDYILLNYRIINKNELERIQKEVAVA
jgi:uncharacterized membrane protein